MDLTEWLRWSVLDVEAGVDALDADELELDAAELELELDALLVEEELAEEEGAAAAGLGVELDCGLVDPTSGKLELEWDPPKSRSMHW